MLDAINSEANERLGRYEILGELGRGAMGVVYLARDPLIARQVALKVFRVGFSASDDELRNLYARFIREAQSAGILSHPNIVTVHDVAQADGDSPAFIAMEYVEGRTLKQILDVPEPILFHRAVGIVTQVAAALDYAHSMGVVHRDVKPGNVLVAADGGVKITDFGIAVINAGNITNYGQLLGTPNYMAPEIIEELEIDHRADLFSLGVVLYELLTRHKPFAGSNLTKVTKSIVQEPFTPPGEYVADLPPELERCLETALQKDPEQRFQTAAHFARALEAALEAATGSSAGPARAAAPASQALGGSDAAPAPESGSAPIEHSRTVEQARPEPTGPQQTGPQETGSPQRGSPQTGPQPVESDQTGPRVTGSPAATAGQTETKESPAATPKSTIGEEPVTAEVAAVPAPRSRTGRMPIWLLALGVVLGVGFGYLMSRALVGDPVTSLPIGTPLVSPLAPLEDRIRDLTAMAAARRSVGDFEGAYLALAEAARIVPDSRIVEAELGEARRRFLQQQDRLLVELDDQLSAANRSFDRGRYGDAAQYAREALALDPMNLEAEYLLATSEERYIQRNAEPPSEPAPSPVQVEERPSPVVVTPEPEVEPEPVAPPEPVVPLPTTASLTLQLETARSPGVVTLYESGEQIFRERFRFTREGKGFIDSLRAKAKAKGGTLSREIEYDAGDVDLRLYVSLPGSPTQVLPFVTELLPGESHVLSIVIAEDGIASASLE